MAEMLGIVKAVSGLDLCDAQSDWKQVYSIYSGRYDFLVRQEKIDLPTKADNIHVSCMCIRRMTPCGSQRWRSLQTIGFLIMKSRSSRRDSIAVKAGRRSNTTHNSSGSHDLLESSKSRCPKNSPTIVTIMSSVASVFSGSSICVTDEPAVSVLAASAAVASVSCPSC